MEKEEKELKIFSSAYLMFSDTVRIFYLHSHKGLEELGLKPSEAQFIHFLNDFQGKSQRELGKIYGLSPSRMSEVISSIENKGLIERKVNENNRRIFQISLTKEGREAVEKIRFMFEEYCKFCLKNFTQEEVSTLEELLLKFSNR